MTRVLVAVTVFWLGVNICGARAEDAIDIRGQRFSGKLVQADGAWAFHTGQAKHLPIRELAFVRFESAASLPPTRMLTKTLLLPGGQRITGALVKLDEKVVEFAVAADKACVLPRGQVVGIVHANDWLPLVREDFETPLKSWSVVGSVNLDGGRHFAGARSLKLDKARQALSRSWPGLAAGRIAFVIGRVPKSPSTRCTVELLADQAWAAAPKLVIDGPHLGCIGAQETFGPFDMDGFWHGVAIEWQDGALRVFVDDRCLAQTPMPARANIAGIRFVTTDAPASSGVFIDELTVARRLRPLALPRSEASQDHVWLEHGEQVFGRITAVDARSVMLDARFGKRAIPWSQLRGIGFAQGKHVPAVAEAEVEYRPGSGYAADRLHVKLLRWDGEKLRVHHSLLGELAIERERLERVRFEAK